MSQKVKAHETFFWQDTNMRLVNRDSKKDLMPAECLLLHGKLEASQDFHSRTMQALGRLGLLQWGLWEYMGIYNIIMV